jgi:hypothetical protein
MFTIAEQVKDLTCVECVMGSPVYAACMKKAEHMVRMRSQEIYPMCSLCADHSIRNRGATLLGSSETPWVITPMPEPEQVQTTTPMMAKLGQLDGIHIAGARVENEYKALNQAVSAAMAEIQRYGDRAAHLAQLFRQLRTARDILDEQLKQFNNALSHVEGGLLPESFDREQLQTLTLSNGDRVTIVQKLYASIGPDGKDAAYAWLHDNGHGDLIQETINSSSLSAFAKQELAEGRELPENIFATFIKPSTSLTRKKVTAPARKAK